jgi:hypothetical protein
MTNLSVDAAGLRSGRAASVIRPRDAGFNPEGPIHRDKSTCRRQIAMMHAILLNCVEPFVSAIDITMGDEVPVYSRASHSRIAVTAVALLLTATAGAPELCAAAADVQSEACADTIGLKLAKAVLPAPFGLPLRVQQSEAPSDLIQPCGAGAAMAGSYAAARRDAAAPRPVKRIREVE